MTTQAAIWIGTAGWVRIAQEGTDDLVYMRFTPDTRGRLVAREVVIDSDAGEPLSGGALSRVPVAETEARVNGHSLMYDEILSGWDAPGPAGGPAAGSNVAVLASHFGNLTTNTPSLSGSWLDLARKSIEAGRPLGKRHPSERNRRATPPDEYRLDRMPGDDGLSDDFLSLVRRAYVAAIERGDPPLKTLARKDLNVPWRTVERWVYIARKRRIMPPARVGTRG